MMNAKKLIETLEPVTILSQELKTLFNAANHLYKEFITNQEKENSGVYFDASFYLFQFMIIKFKSFKDAYYGQVAKEITEEKRRKIGTLFKKVDIQKIEKIRNVVLAHHFDDNGKSAVKDISNGKYNYASGSPLDYELLMQVASDIIDIIYKLEISELEL